MEACAWRWRSHTVNKLAMTKRQKIDARRAVDQDDGLLS
jgi:hypothetical protein